MNKLMTFSALASALLLASPVVNAQTIQSEKSVLSIEKVAEGLEHPWGLAFLPDGRMLVTERAGKLRLVNTDGSLSAPLQGLPDIVVNGQGGLLDVVLHPDFASNKQFYFSFNQPGENGSSTAVALATLSDTAISDLKIVFSANPKFESRHHFGGRLVIQDNNYLFITLGDRGQRRDDAQTLDNHHGKVIRLHLDGSVPTDNPYVKDAAVLDDIWSYGHRNIQGAALHPATGELWTHEHGPQGGDEINVTRATLNYGWPVITYGEEYGGGNIGQTKKAGLEQPMHYWVPSIAPSGMSFYLSDAIPGWKDSLLVGSLKFGQLVRLELNGEKVSHEERIMIGQRIRDVRQGPDGAVYLLTDQINGQILRLKAAN
ncbi:MAG: PQQ-dependent sugar dehydrogenase [Alishewanella sp.]|nr:PQQ-dependent sugar dehydrogenase [Alishewanella sp.]MDP5185972.1 PQQ-dependent sugar dehydrogenase [Alishewanella sp.]